MEHGGARVAHSPGGRSGIRQREAREPGRPQGEPAPGVRGGGGGKGPGWDGGRQRGARRWGEGSGMWEAVTCVEVVRAFEGLVHESLLLRLPASAGPSVCTRGRVELRPSGENVSLHTECVCTGECVCRSCT